MYAPSKIAERLRLISEEFRITPEYHSVSEVESFERHMIDSGHYLYDDLGKVKGTQNLTDFESAWIQNEQLLCASDAAYWLTRYSYLIDEEGTVLRFSFRPAQTILFGIIADLESRNLGIEIMVLKARQLGITSLIQPLIGHRIFFGYGANAIAGSADQQKTGIMASKMLLAYDMMPFWMRPQATRRVESDRGMLVFGGTLSGVSFQHGAQMSGIARGTTPTIYHLSEVASFTDAQSQIEDSLFKCVHASPKIFGVLESTGEGDKGWWPDTWRKSRDSWPLSRLCPLFLPWFCGIGLYPTPTWLRQRPIPHDWSPNRDTIQHSAKANLYVASSPLLSKALGAGWTLPREQQWWWEVEHEQAKASSDGESHFLQEYCLTGDTRISTEKGIIRLDQAKDCHKSGNEVLSRWIQRDPKPIWEVKTEDGRKLRGTGDHSVYLKGSWSRRIDALKPGDCLRLLPMRFSSEQYIHTWSWTPTCEFHISITPRLGRFLGYFMGDGDYYSGNTGMSIDAKDSDIVSDVQSLYSEFLGSPATELRKGGVVYLRKGCVRWGEVLRGLGCLEPAFHKNLDRNCGWKRKVCVPECIFRSPREVVREFLSAVFESDGHAYTKSARVVVWSKWDSFLRDIQILLMGFSIRSRFASLEKKNGEGRIYTGRALAIPAAYVNKFYDEIGFISERKRKGGMRRTVTDRRAARFEAMEDKVVSVQPLGINESVYDITVESSHAFSANGIAVHNCGDDEEALQMSIVSVFGHKAISDIDTRRKRDYSIYAFSGQSIEDAHEPPPDDIDYDAERVPVQMTNTKGETHRWELIPLRFRSPLRESDPDDAIGKLFVFHPPVPGVRYAMGIDTCAGMGLDSTCISVWGIGQRTQPDFQAAEFTSPYVSHVEAYAFGAAIGAYYARYMTQETTKYPMPYCAVEQVAAVGDTCQLQMIHLGYPLRCFHKMVRYDNTPAKIKRQRQGKLGKLGWFTWPWSRPILIDNFVHSAQNGWAEINSPWLIEEMKHFEVRVTATGKEKMEHADDSHDDRIFAGAMAIFCSHDMDALSERSKKRLPEGASTLPPVDISPYTGQVVSAGELRQPRALTLQDIIYSDTNSLRRNSY